VLAVELGSLLAGALVAGVGLSNWFLAWALLTLIPLGALVIIDVEEQLLPDRLIVLALPLILLTGFARFSNLTLFGGLLGALMAGGLIGGLWLVTRGQGMGFGDAKLAAVFGAGLGVAHSLTFLFLSFTSGAAVGLLLIAAGRGQFGQRLAFGPFLIVGYLLTLAVGPDLVAWYSGIP
jgi:prepilin signal peptidase PulO-like enzyme (type II secretory pathway)